MNFHGKETMHVTSIVLKVKDLNLMKSFYQEMLGFHVNFEDETKVDLGTTVHTFLTLKQDKNAVIPKRMAGLYHVAYLLPSRGDLAQLTMHLYQSGFQFGAGDHHVSEAIYLHDPEGNGIEIYADRDPQGWVWRRDEIEMSTDPVDFDDLFKEIDKPFERIPNETKIGHLHFQVANLKTHQDFYQKGLGFDLVSHIPQALFLSDGHYHHHIAFNTWLGTKIENPKPNTLGLKAYTINIPHQKDKDEILTRLQGLGFKIKANSMLDPSGIQVILKVLKKKAGKNNG